MIDYSNIPSITNHQTFFATGTDVWQTWQKPRNCNFVYITAIGGGGGGGSAQVTSGDGGGGGGGGSSSITSILVPSVLIPDTLYVYVGLGGDGGTAGGDGSAGQLSYVTILPNTTTSNTLIRSGSSSASGGQVGTTLSAGLGGSGGLGFVSPQNGFFSSLGIITTTTGDDGANGGAPGFNAGNTKTALSTLPLTGGGGGGGKSNTNGGAGGSILAGGVLGRVAGGVGATTGGPGGNGVQTITPQNLTYSSTEFPFATTGGAGGGGRSSGVAGNGGIGSIGSGGGGGGAGSGNPNANGGRGGNGLVIISAF
jgi:hypothetical protein